MSARQSLALGAAYGVIMSFLGVTVVGFVVFCLLVALASTVYRHWVGEDDEPWF